MDYVTPVVLICTEWSGVTLCPISAEAVEEGIQVPFPLSFQTQVCALFCCCMVHHITSGLFSTANTEAIVGKYRSPGHILVRGRWETGCSLLILRMFWYFSLDLRWTIRASCKYQADRKILALLLQGIKWACLRASLKAPNAFYPAAVPLFPWAGLSVKIVSLKKIMELHKIKVMRMGKCAYISVYSHSSNMVAVTKYILSEIAVLHLILNHIVRKENRDLDLLCWCFFSLCNFQISNYKNLIRTNLYSCPYRILWRDHIAQSHYYSTLSTFEIIYFYLSSSPKLNKAISWQQWEIPLWKLWTS